MNAWYDDTFPNQPGSSNTVQTRNRQLYDLSREPNKKNETSIGGHSSLTLNIKENKDRKENIEYIKNHILLLLSRSVL